VRARSLSRVSSSPNNQTWRTVVSRARSPQDHAQQIGGGRDGELPHLVTARSMRLQEQWDLIGLMTSKEHGKYAGQPATTIPVHQLAQQRGFRLNAPVQFTRTGAVADQAIPR
jgi:hypothetical protein